MTEGPAGIHFVIPYVGDPAYLRLAVESVLAQSDPHWLLTVVEDGPQGHQVEGWLVSLGDDRISYELNARRLGINGNFQRCLDLASTPWVVFLGCDDMVMSNYVAAMSRAIDSHPGVAVVQPGVEVMDEHGRTSMPLPDRVKRWVAPRSTTVQALGGERLVASLLRGNWAYFPSLCWRRDAIAGIGFRQDLPTTLDLALLVDVLLAGWELATTPEVAFRYRRHPASASSVAASSAVRFEEESRLFGEIAAASHDRGWEHACRAARLHMTSRLHALSCLPQAVRGHRPERVAATLAHVLEPPRHRTRTEALWSR
jgi:glycosyltransferase involved in cell wall biosynthesis